MRKKLNWKDVVNIFQPSWIDNIQDTNDSRRTSNATRKGHKHNHRPARIPKGMSGKFSTTTTPAEWRRQHMGKA